MGIIHKIIQTTKKKESLVSGALLRWKGKPSSSRFVLALSARSNSPTEKLVVIRQDTSSSTEFRVELVSRGNLELIPSTEQPPEWAPTQDAALALVERHQTEAQEVLDEHLRQHL